LLAWVFLLPPWAGFDEPFHHSYALDQQERLRWPAFGSLKLRPDVADALRDWNRAGGTHHLADTLNYETQQSPLYYWLAGLSLRFLPPSTPITTLYTLRLWNAGATMLAALLTAWAARRLFGAWGWLPVAYLALVPGFALALVRVSNDALAALLISVAVASTIVDGPIKSLLAGSLAAGISTWAKLYGAADIPGSLVAAMHGQRRVLRWLLAVVPALLLLALSRIVHGHVFPLQENILIHGEPGWTRVPWARDVWTLAKTHLFVSGVPSLVFPKAVYLVALVPLGFAAVRTLSCWGTERRRVLLVGLPLFAFVAALLYHAWRNYSVTQGPGGTGGWYMWAMLLPESLWISWGLARRPVAAAWRTLGMGFFAILTFLGDLVLFGQPGDALIRVGQEVWGFRFRHVSEVWKSFADSRPAICALLAVVFVLASWIVILWGVLRSADSHPSQSASLAR
jgi:hypothetical protein